jgi:hypothetical protein
MAVHSTEGILQSKTQTLPAIPLGVSVMNVRGSSFICHRTTNAIDTIDINSDKEAI